MSFITLANTNKIIFNTDIRSLDLTGDIYKIPIYFFSKYEENALLAIQELLKDPDKYFTEIYKPYKPIDTYSYVYEGQKPAYHKFSCCPRLQSDYQNFEVPQEIKDKGPEAVQEFRQWFESVKHLLDKPDIFIERLRITYGIVTNPKAINRENSGSTIMENLTIKELEENIDVLIKEAGSFYYKNEKNTAILKKFSKHTHLAYKSDNIYNNDIEYSDEVVKEILKSYDEEFKKPLKRYLIEYYRLKLNPEIKMEGHFLEQLGFVHCGYCHSDDYSPHMIQGTAENQTYKLNWDFLLDNGDFFNQLFSSYFPFKENELIKYRDILSIGSPYLVMDSGTIHSSTIFGLIFNNKIKWTENLKKIYYKEPRLIYAGGSTDEYSYAIDFGKLPLSFIEELENIKSISQSKILSAYEYCEEEGYYDSLSGEMDRSKNYYLNISQQAYFDKQELMILANNSVYEFIANKNVYLQFMEELKKDISDFTIEVFYKKSIQQNL